MSESKEKIIGYISVITIGLAGLVHLMIVPAHYAHAPAHGIFFAVAGLAQCAWAVAFWRWPSLNLYRAGLAVSGGFVVLWLLTLALPAPFGGHDARAIDAGMMMCKVSELTGLIALVALALQGGQFATAGKLSISRRIAEALLVSVIVGLGSYGLGKAAEPIFPQWQHPHAQVEHSDSEHDPDHAEHDHDLEHNEHSHDTEHGDHDHN